MHSADGSARCRAPAAVSPPPGAGLPAAPAVPAQAPEVPQPAARYTFDQEDRTSGEIADSSGNGLTASLVNASTARSVARADGGKALALPGGAPASDGAYILLPREVPDAASDLAVAVRVKWGGDKSSWQRIFDLGAALGPEQIAGTVGNAPTLRQLSLLHRVPGVFDPPCGVHLCRHSRRRLRAEPHDLGTGGRRLRRSGGAPSGQERCRQGGHRGELGSPPTPPMRRRGRHTHALHPYLLD
ncbi:hypothetical protein [Streptomyces sp. IMTB 2501]|uniref:hypothetical protein n=1 Tax=Streptomyces sp. IMTB 2501 TaxID=1776340 RepID=UPI0021167742|nr:hypothetical protein [Streptomyces sp. IMTB 2501]